MGAIDCLIISLISIAWGCIWFSIGDTIRDTTLHDGLGFFIQLVGAIFIAAPVILIILIISIEIIMTMFCVAKTMLSAIPVI